MTDTITLLQAAEQVLEALEYPFDTVVIDGARVSTKAKEAITALRAAIEAAKQQPTNGYQAYQEHKRKRLEEAGFLKEPLREAAKCVEPDCITAAVVYVRNPDEFSHGRYVSWLTNPREFPHGTILYTAPPADAKDKK